MLGALFSSMSKKHSDSDTVIRHKKNNYNHYNKDCHSEDKSKISARSTEHRSARG